MRKEKRMDKSKFRCIILFVLMGLGIIYVASMLIFTEAKNMYFDNEEVEEIVGFHVKSSTLDSDVVCPVALETPSGEVVTYTTVMEKEYSISNVIMVRSSFQYIKAYINDECVLSYGEEQKTFSHIMPPSAWHIIRPRKTIMPGDVLKIELICDIDPYQGYFRGAWVGTKTAMLYMIIKTSKMSLLICIPLLILGILYVVICRIFPEKISRRKLCILGLLSALTSIWILLESHVTQFVWGIMPVSYTLLFVIFSILPLLICELLFQYKMFQKSMPTKIAYGTIVCCFFIFHGLQIFGIYQYVNSVWIIHLGFLAIIIAFIIETIRRIKGKRYKDDRDMLIAGTVFAIFGLLDLINKYIFNEIIKDDVVFVQIGIFSFMLLLGYYTLRRAINEHDSSMEQEFWKQVAHTDPLTKLGNRLRFEERKREIRKSKHNLGLTVAIVDINDLKIINDEYGHEMGDVAIATVGQALIETFDQYGEGFRIGGDEFCLFLGMLSKEQAMKKTKECEAMLKDFFEEYEICLQIAKGFSEVDENGIDAAINTADAEMYKNKEINKIKRMKRESKNHPFY